MNSIKHYLTSVALILGLSSVSPLIFADDSTQTLAYISTPSTIVVFDPEKETITKQITLPSKAQFLHTVDVTANGKVAYELHSTQYDSISQMGILNATTHELTGNVTGFDDNTDVFQLSLAIAPTTTFAYVGEGTHALETNTNIEIIDTTYQTVVGTVNNYPSEFWATHIAFTPNGEKAIAIDDKYYIKNDPSLLFIHTQNHDVTTTQTTPFHIPTHILMMPDNKTAYVSSINMTAADKQYELMVLDLASESVKKYIVFPTKDKFIPASLATTPDSKKVYILRSKFWADKSVISILDTTSDTITGTIELPVPRDSGSKRIAISPDGKKAYVTYDDETGHLTIIDVATDKVIKTIENEALRRATDIVFFQTTAACCTKISQG